MTMEAAINERTALDCILGVGVDPHEIINLENSYLTEASWGDGEADDGWYVDIYDYYVSEDQGGIFHGASYIAPYDFLPIEAMRPAPPEPIKPYKKVPVPQELRWAVFRRDGYRCVRCGYDADLTADHIEAEVRGGRAGIDNLQTLCRKCNSRKGAR